MADMSSYYEQALQQQQKQRKPQPTNPFVWALIGAVVPPVLLGISMFSMRDESVQLTPAVAFVCMVGSSLVGAVVAFLLGGRDWLAYKLSGGNPSDQLMSNLRAGTYALLILGPFACLGAIGLYMWSTEPKQPQVATAPPPLPTADPANMHQSPGQPVRSTTPIDPPVAVPSTPIPAVPATPIPFVPPTVAPPTPFPTQPTIPEPALEAPASLPVDPSAVPAQLEPASPTSTAFAIETGTPPKEAYEKFVAKYGESAVVRIVVQVPGSAADAEDTIRQALMTALANAHEPYVYVALQGTTAAAIAAPVEDIGGLARLFGTKANVQADRRLVSLDFNDVSGFVRKQEAAAAKQNGEFQRLTKMVEQGDLRNKVEGYRQLSMLKTPEVAEYLVGRLGIPSDGLWAEEAVRAMGPLAQKPLLKLAAKGDGFAAMSAIELIVEVGTKEILPELEALAKSDNFHVSARAKMAVQRLRAK
jgi:hypothetical protein